MLLIIQILDNCMIHIRIFLSLVIICLVSCSRKLTKFQLTPEKHLLILYSATHPHASPTKISFRIQLNSTDFVIDKEYMDNTLYLDSALKHKVNGAHVQARKLPKSTNINEDEQIVQGIIGLRHGSDFIRVLKSSLKIDELKLWFKINENQIQIIPEGCRNPLFAPYTLEVSEEHHHQFLQVDRLSLNLTVQSKKLLSFLNKTTNPFSISPSELHSKVNIKLLNLVQTVSVGDIVKKCRKISNSANSQCQLGKSEVDDYGLLLFEFDPIICLDRDAIELKQEDKIDSVGYYWTHLFLILIEITLAVLFQRRHRIARKISCFIKSTKLK